MRLRCHTGQYSTSETAYGKGLLLWSSLFKSWQKLKQSLWLSSVYRRDLEYLLWERSFMALILGFKEFKGTSKSIGQQGKGRWMRWLSISRESNLEFLCSLRSLGKLGKLLHLEIWPRQSWRFLNFTEINYWESLQSKVVRNMMQNSPHGANSWKRFKNWG